METIQIKVTAHGLFSIQGQYRIAGYFRELNFLRFPARWLEKKCLRFKCLRGLGRSLNRGPLGSGNCLLKYKKIDILKHVPSNFHEVLKYANGWDLT